MRVCDVCGVASVKGALETKYKFVLLRSLLCPNNNDANFIANRKQIIEISRKTCEAVAIS